MAGRSKRSAEASELLGTSGSQGAHILIIEAPYYEGIVVPGALEIAQALAQAVKADLIGSDEVSARFDGCVALGCVIRGETSHYDIVCENANHWLMQVAIANAIPLGNAILTVDTEAQALERARGGRKGKGADAVRACLALIALERVFASEEGE